MSLLRIILLFALFSSLKAQNTQVESWIDAVMEQTINSNFHTAESLLTLKTIPKKAPLIHSFYTASVLSSKMTHYENQAEDRRFRKAVERTLFLADSLLALNKNNSKEQAKLYFYKGSALGYLGYYAGQTQSWFAAYSNGTESVEYLEKCIAVDSTYWDAYLGIGVYYYWRSARLNWLPFLKDRKEEGIDLIMKTIAHQGRSRYLAMHQLIYILLDYKSYDQALYLGKKVVEKYPQSAFMYWAYSHVLMKQKNYSLAIAAYKNLIEILSADSAHNPNHMLTAHVRMADMYAQSKNCTEAMAAIKWVEKKFTKAEITANEEVSRLIGEIKNRCNSNGQ